MSKLDPQREPEYGPTPHFGPSRTPGFGVGYSPPRPQAGPPKRKGLPVWVVLAGAVVLVVLACWMGAVALFASAGPVVDTAGIEPGSGRSGGREQLTPLEPEVPSHPIGAPFRSGELEYTVHGVKTGIAELGGPYNKLRPQGHYVRVDLTVGNPGQQPEQFSSERLLKIEDTKTRVFSADSMANLVGNEDRTGLLTEINPGNDVRLYVYFDLPEGATPGELMVSPDLLTFAPDAVVPLR